MVGYIYFLIDPFSYDIRYVGKSKGCIQKRLKQHILYCYKTNTHKNNWIKSVIEKGALPYTKCIQTVEYSMLNACEIAWIACLNILGVNLTNLTKGGDGTLGVSCSNITRQKIADKAKGRKHTKETKLKLRLIKLGTKLSNDVKEKISVSNRKPKNKLHCENISKARQGIRLSEEHRQGIGKASKDRMTDDRKKALSDFGKTRVLPRCPITGRLIKKKNWLEC